MIVMKQHAQKEIVTTSKIKGHIILKKEKKRLHFLQVTKKFICT